MTIDLTDTTTGAISQALTEARHRLGGMTLGMVLTLIIVTDEAAQYDAIRAANQAAREHPCRVLAVITRKPKADSRLDAEIRVGESSPGETIVLRMYGPLGQHADSVVAPLLVPDVPVVTWWPDNAPDQPAKHPLGALAQRRVTDSAAAEAPQHMLAGLAAAYQPGDTDFAWTRATPWRTLLAATLDQAHPRDHRGRDRGRGGQPHRRPDRGVAVAAAGRAGGADRLRRPGDHPRQVHHGGGRHRDHPGRRAHRHAGLAGADRPEGGAAPPGHPPSCWRRSCAASTRTRSTRRRCTTRTRTRPWSSRKRTRSSRKSSAIRQPGDE